MVRVTKGQIKAGGVYYDVGKIISGLSKEDEARLISLEVAEKVQSEEETSDNGNMGTKAVDKPDKSVSKAGKPNKSGKDKTKTPENQDNQGDSNNQDKQENSEDSEATGSPEAINIEFKPEDVIVGK